MEEFVVNAKDSSRDMIKYLSFNILFAIGAISIVLAIICRKSRLDEIWIGPFPLSISLMENIGAAFIIPPLFFYIFLYISKWFEPRVTRRPKLATLIKNMKSELKIIGINLYDAHSGEEREHFKKSMEEIVKKAQQKGQFKFYLHFAESCITIF